MIVDVHGHLFHEDFDEDRDEVIRRAENAGVTTIINNGLNPATNRETLRLRRKYNVCEAALGVYPWDAVEPTKNEIEEELRFIKKQRKHIVGIGETGLDYSFKDNQAVDAIKAKQKWSFIQHIALSQDLRKPIIIHSRRAEEDVIELLEEHNAKNVVLHCFTGKKKLWKRGLKNKYVFSIPPLAVKLEQFQQLIAYADTRQLLLETDSPYLSHNKERNEPCNVLHTLKLIADIKDSDVEEIKRALYMNYKLLFKN